MQSPHAHDTKRTRPLEPQGIWTPGSGVVFCRKTRRANNGTSQRWWTARVEPTPSPAYPARQMAIHPSFQAPERQRHGARVVTRLAREHPSRAGWLPRVLRLLQTVLTSSCDWTPVRRSMHRRVGTTGPGRSCLDALGDLDPGSALLRSFDKGAGGRHHGEAIGPVLWVMAAFSATGTGLTADPRVGWPCT